MARDTVRDQWRRDNQKTEYKELMNALDMLFAQHIEYGITNPKIPEDYEALREVEKRFLVTVRDRIFIVDMVEELKIQERFIKAVRAFEAGSRYNDAIQRNLPHYQNRNT